MKDVFLKRVEDVVESEVDGELVMLHLRSGHYFGIDGVGVRIWALLTDPIGIEAIAETRSEEFDVGIERARADTIQFCDALKDTGLVEACP